MGESRQPGDEEEGVYPDDEDGAYREEGAYLEEDTYLDDEEGPDDAGQPREVVRGELARAALAGARQLTELTGKPTTGVVSAEPIEDGWLIGVEVVEDHRIPSSIDLLGLYHVEVDDDGELIAYRRVRRYPRGKSEVS